MYSQKQIMAIYQKWLIGLDNTAMDNHLFRFINIANNPLSYEELHFVHIASSIGLTDKVGPQNEVEDGLERIKRELEEKITENLPGKKFHLHVIHGNPAKDLIKISKKTDPDLLVLGRKENSGAEGVKPEELVAVANCSSLLLPAYNSYSFEKIIVAIDFSKISKLAFNKAYEITSKEGTDLLVQHVCMVPSDFRRTGKNYDEYADKQKSMAQNEADEFLQGFDSKLNIEYTYADKNEIADSIAAFAKDKKADLLIMGSKGRTNAASVFLGSIAEKTANQLANVPLMVVKEKNSNMGLLQSIIN